MRSLFFTLLILTGLACMAQKPLDMHEPWTELLQAHVDSNGWVSYEGFRNDTVKLNSYLSQLSANPPASEWRREEKLAFWINAYNAFTVKLIVDHYPVSSIKEIKRGVPFVSSVWDLRFIQICGKEMDLNQIEHQILRKEFDEPRIHFAIVCASKSCPQLRNEAYNAENLEQQLQEQAVYFIRDENKNYFGQEQIRISPIFKWFRKDFSHEMTLLEYLKQYAEHDFASHVKVEFNDYNWSLNGE